MQKVRSSTLAELGVHHSRSRRATHDLAVVLHALGEANAAAGLWRSVRAAADLGGDDRVSVSALCGLATVELEHAASLGPGPERAVSLLRASRAVQDAHAAALRSLGPTDLLTLTTKYDVALSWLYREMGERSKGVLRELDAALLQLPATDEGVALHARVTGTARGIARVEGAFHVAVAAPLVVAVACVCIALASC
ncbi:MAG: hypothetical protein H6732_09340 [Alphaproteobacteria bacterium]|nr:hypothetical protein [Alphaproteobacteria bacterium]